MDFDHSNFHELIEYSEEYDNGKVYKIGDQVIFRDATYEMVEEAGSSGYAPERAGDKLWIKIKDEPFPLANYKTPETPETSGTAISGNISPAPATGSPDTHSDSPAIGHKGPSWDTFKSPSFNKPNPSIFGNPDPSFEHVPPVFRSPVPKSPVPKSPVSKSSTPLIASSSERKSGSFSFTIIYVIISIIIIGLVAYKFFGLYK
jgi:hypothetical protein